MSDEPQVDSDYAAKVDEEMANWSQGDVAIPMLCTWVTDGRPITPEGAELETDGPAIVQMEPSSVVVVTQTCDVRRNCWTSDNRGRPFVQVSPLVRLKDKVLEDASGGFSPRFAPVPGAGADAFADLDRCTTVEKGVLARATEHIVGCETETDRHAFSRALARQRGRHPFPDCVEESLTKLRSYLRDKRNRSGPSGDAVRAIDSIRASAFPSFSDSEPFDLRLTFIINPIFLAAVSSDENFDLSASHESWLADHPTPSSEQITKALFEASESGDRFDLWQRAVADWVKKCTPVSPITSVSADAESLASYSLGRARREPNLDLDHLTSEESRTVEGEVFDPGY
jgi:hypothetical protein